MAKLTKPGESLQIKIKEKDAIPGLIEELKKMDIRVFRADEKETWKIDGFYMAKGLMLKFSKDRKLAYAYPAGLKNIEGVEIENMSDLVMLNYSWWMASRQRSLEYVNPDPFFKEIFSENSMATRKSMYIPIGESAPA